jgi:starch phosphorylase
LESTIDLSRPIAYCSAEYGLHRSLPFYAVGLGFWAGDHIKECSDLGIPLVAVGFMYPEGYVHQVIREDGWVRIMKETIKSNAATYSARRMVKEYVQKFYTKALKES